MPSPSVSVDACLADGCSPGENRPPSGFGPGSGCSRPPLVCGPWKEFPFPPFLPLFSDGREPETTTTDTFLVTSRARTMVAAAPHRASIARRSPPGPKLGEERGREREKENVCVRNTSSASQTERATERATAGEMANRRVWHRRHRYRPALRCAGLGRGSECARRQ